MTTCILVNAIFIVRYAHREQDFGALVKSFLRLERLQFEASGTPESRILSKKTRVIESVSKQFEQILAGRRQFPAAALFGHQPLAGVDFSFSLVDRKQLDACLGFDL